MFGKQSQFNGWDLASAEHAPGFFDDLDAMLQEPVGLSSFKANRALRQCPCELESLFQY